MARSGHNGRLTLHQLLTRSGHSRRYSRTCSQFLRERSPPPAIFKYTIAYAGGAVFLNDAPNTGPDTLDLGFGVTMTWGGFNYAFASSEATVLDATLLTGGIAANYTGNYFSHSIVSGGGISNRVSGSAGIIFGSLNSGDGCASFGGQTTTNFHQPNADAQQLLANQLGSAASCGTANAVPTPATLPLFATGLGLLGLFGWW